jgi:hypothetical protein
MGRIAVWIVGKLLKSDLSTRDRNTLVIHILDTLHALPLRDTIYVADDGTLIVNGRSLTLEEMKALRESARAALDNRALNLIREQVSYQAINVALASKAQLDIDLYFSRAAIWWGQQVDAKLALLAQRTPEPPSLED